MDGNVMYEMARQRIAEQHRTAELWRLRRLAREHRANTGRRRARDAAERAVTPAIPDFADEMFGERGDAVPAREDLSGRLARPGR